MRLLFTLVVAGPGPGTRLSCEEDGRCPFAIYPWHQQHTQHRCCSSESFYLISPSFGWASNAAPLTLSGDRSVVTIWFVSAYVIASITASITTIIIASITAIIIVSSMTSITASIIASITRCAIMKFTPWKTSTVINPQIIQRLWCSCSNTWPRC